jgi:hypothetical protein
MVRTVQSGYIFWTITATCAISALVLSLETELVLPQFHVTFDPTFQTMLKQFLNNILISQWQYKTGFINKEEETTVIKQEDSTNWMVISKSLPLQAKIQQSPQQLKGDDQHQTTRHN